jgi:hypothetical protein
VAEDSRSRYRGALSQGNGFAQLLGRPFLGRMSSDAEMENAAAVVRRHEEDIQDLNRMVGTVKRSTDTMPWM